MCNPEGALNGMQVGLPELVSVASSDGHGKRRLKSSTCPVHRTRTRALKSPLRRNGNFAAIAAAEKERQFVLSLEKERELAAAAAALVNERALAQVNLLRYRPYS